ERASALDCPDRLALPVPLVDTDDPNAAFLASVTVADPAEFVALLDTALVDTALVDSPELGRRARVALPDRAGEPPAPHPPPPGAPRPRPRPPRPRRPPGWMP